MKNLLNPRKPGIKGIVLCGIGGSGKTQTTLHFIMNNQKDFSAIIWIDASTIEHTKQSFAEAASRISTHWPTHDNPMMN